MSVFMHISDPHFGTERSEVVAGLEQLVVHQQPDLVVLTGDITQRARRHQFEAARAFVARMARPTLVIPGNHDVPLFNILGRCFWPYANFRRAFGSALEPHHDSEQLLVVCVNSTSRWRHKDGVLDDTAIERVAERLRRARTSQLRVVALHHPVHAITAADEENLVRGHRRAVPAWADAGADLILGGHIHLPYVRPLREHFPELSRDVWAVQAGTAVSTRTRGDTVNSVHVVVSNANLAGRPECRVEQWDYAAASASFVRVRQSAMLLERAHA